MDIITYPLNDTVYTAADAGAYFATRSSGVFSANDNLSVKKADATHLSVSAGLAWMLTDSYWGKAVYSKESVLLEVPTPDPLLNRICRVVLRFVKAENKSKILVLTGSPASDPIAPTRNTGNDIYDLVLADYLQTAGETEINASNLIDQRLNENLCGLMRDGVERIPSDTLYEEWRGRIKELEDELAEARSGGAYQAPLMFANTNIPASAWEITNEYADYPVSCQVTLSGVNESLFPEVVYAYEQIASGVFASICNSYNGGIKLYASAVPQEDITVPTIICFRRTA